MPHGSLWPKVATGSEVLYIAPSRCDRGGERRAGEMKMQVEWRHPSKPCGANGHHALCHTTLPCVFAFRRTASRHPRGTLALTLFATMWKQQAAGLTSRVADTDASRHRCHCSVAPLTSWLITGNACAWLKLRDVQISSLHQPTFVTTTTRTGQVDQDDVDHVELVPRPASRIHQTC